MNQQFFIEKMLPEDYPSVNKIYEEGIATGHATFQTAAPNWQNWDKSHLPDARLVARSSDDGLVLGWGALTPVSSRCVYAGVAEVSIYVAKSAREMGVGQAILQELIGESEKIGLWTLQSGIFPENLASIKLHEKCGFRIVGRRERIGKMGEIWRDNLLLERRSLKNGV
jgi:L-amino acid N-acyltransferase YncA